jgi:hypothetical protein
MGLLLCRPSEAESLENMAHTFPHTSGKLSGVVGVWLGVHFWECTSSEVGGDCWECWFLGNTCSE